MLVLTMLIPAVGNFLRAFANTLGMFYFAITLSGIGFHAGSAILLGRLGSVWFPNNKAAVLVRACTCPRAVRGEGLFPRKEAEHFFCFSSLRA